MRDGRRESGGTFGVNGFTGRKAFDALFFEDPKAWGNQMKGNKLVFLTFLQVSHIICMLLAIAIRDCRERPEQELKVEECKIECHGELASQG